MAWPGAGGWAGPGPGLGRVTPVRDSGRPPRADASPLRSAVGGAAGSGWVPGEPGGDEKGAGDLEGRAGRAPTCPPALHRWRAPRGHWSRRAAANAAPRRLAPQRTPARPQHQTRDSDPGSSRPPPPENLPAGCRLSSVRIKTFRRCCHRAPNSCQAIDQGLLSGGKREGGGHP